MRPIFLLAGLLSLGLLAGCSAHRGEPISEPIRIDSPKAARGEKAYMYYCNKCHPGGERGLGFSINNQPLPGPMIKLQVRAGTGAMPSFSRQLLPEEQLDEIVDYIETLRKQ